MAEVTLIDRYCKIESFLAFSVTGPSLEHLDLKAGAPFSVKVERASLSRYEKSISVISAILISKVQLCSTSSASWSSVFLSVGCSNLCSDLVE